MSEQPKWHDPMHAALHDVNAMRADLGYAPLESLVPGRKHLVTQCPIARSIPIPVSVKAEVRVHRKADADRLGGRYHDLSSESMDFICEFDSGAYPHLEAES